MKRGQKRGFTVIELLVVIVVIAILATIISVMYNAAQAQARNTKIRDAAVKVAEATQLFAAKTGHFPIGGNGSTVPISDKECADGADGWFDVGNQCTVSDTLVASGYLPVDLETGLPPNANYTSTPKSSVMVYKLSATQAMVFYSMENPTATDTTNFNTQMTKCGLNPGGTVAQRDTYGMRGGICFDY